MKGDNLFNHNNSEEEMANGMDAVHQPDPKENVEAMKKTIGRSDNSEPRPIGLRGYLVGLLVAWTVFVGTVLLWNLFRERREILEIALHDAQTSFEKDLVYRRWAAGHGGVYVPVSEQTPPNPYLSHIKERDITTPSGRQLTLINPAYMTRQVHELGAEQYGLRGHITSLNSIRAENAADPWEKEVLRSFEQGAAEVSSVEELDGHSYMRLMRPLITEERCLKCHAGQGYKVGEIRGGISVSVPMEPLWAIARGHAAALVLGHSFLWILGLSGIGVGAWSLRHRIRERDQAEEALENLVKFPSENPNPVFRVKSNGELLYANDACRSFLAEWNHTIGQMVPDNWHQTVSEVLTSGSQKMVEIEHSGRIFSFAVAPIAEADYVNFYGRDITINKRLEVVLQKLAHLEDPEQILDTITREAAQILGCEKVSIVLLEEPHKTSAKVAAKYVNPEGPLEPLGAKKVGEKPIPFETHPNLAKALLQGEANVSEATGLCHYIKEKFGLELPPGKTFYYVREPLIVQNNIIGILSLTMDNWALDALEQRRRGILLSFVSFAAVAVARAQQIAERKKAEDKLREYRQHLEELVEERTKQLKATNKQLEQDIDKRKKMEETLRRSRQTYESLVNSIEGIVWEADAQTFQFFFVSNQAERLLGYPVERWLTEPAFWRDHIHPDDREWAVALCKKATADKSNHEFEYRMTATDGRTVWLRDIVTVVVENDKAVKLRGVMIDITNHKVAKEEKKKMEVQLRQAQKMEAIGTLAGGIAHDFNNILAALIGYADLAKDDIPEGTLAHQNQEEVIIAANRAKDLVKQILTFSRKDEAKLIPVQINSIVIEALKMLRSSLPTTIEINQDINCNNAIMADETHIYQVLLNLGTNAAHAMAENGGVLEVNLSDVTIDSDIMTSDENLQQGSYVKLTVKDIGCGMSKELQGRIFEPFYTTKEVGKGTGMGLSVVHGIVENHNGIISVDSNPGEGTTFEIFFPCIESIEIMETDDTEVALGQGEQILLVDDEKSLVDMLTQMLQRIGYQVIGKTNSDEALKIFQEDPGKFDLVIIDQTMPNIKGTELAKELMKIRPEIPIVLCTGYSESVDSESAKAIGIKELVMKPVNRKEISQVIREILDKKGVTV